MKQQTKRPFTRFQKVMLVVFIITLVGSLVMAGFLLYGYMQMMDFFRQLGINATQDTAIGIIGSADGPTAIFVSNYDGSSLLFVLACLAPIILCIISGIALLISRRRDRKNNYDSE